jgi:hypothetical protein
LADSDFAAADLGDVFGPWLWAKPEKAEKNNRRPIDPARRELLNMHFIRYLTSSIPEGKRQF